MAIDVEVYERDKCRTVPVTVSVLKDGKVEKAVLDIKYKPIDRTWLARTQQLRAKADDEVEKLVQDATALDKRQMKAVLMEDQEQAKVELEAIKRERDALKAREESVTEELKRENAEHLADTLIDVDMTRQGEPVKPDAEFLMGLDIEFMADIQEAIGKKTFRQTTT